MSTIFVMLVAFGVGQPEISASLSNADIARYAEEAFREGVARRSTADAARPYFRQAADYFDELRHRSATNPILYRNLGNSQLLAGDLPAAILSFRRGLDLSPADPDLAANLAEARGLVVYPSAHALGRQPIESDSSSWLRLRGDWVIYLAASLYIGSWIFLTRWLMVRRRGELAMGLALLCLAGAASMLFLNGYRGASHYPLVVIAEDGVLLRKGDNLAFPPRYDVPLNRGVEARLLFTRGDWVQIELTDGEVGWAPKKFVLVDE